MVPTRTSTFTEPHVTLTQTVEPPSEISPSDVNNPARKIAFYCAAAMVFLRVSMLHQLLTYEMHVNLYYLYVFGIPAIMGVLLSGGVQRTFYGKAAYCWVGFTAWLLISVPFSTWHGGSFPLVSGYVRTDIPILFMVAGLTLTWKEFRLMLWVMAWSGVVNIAAAKLFMVSGNTNYGYRLALTAGTVSDPNDFAAHMLFVSPFLLWVVFTSKSAVMRMFFLVCSCTSAFIILKTASRGAAVAMAVFFLYYLWRATPKQKIVTIVLLPIGLAIGAATVSPEALRRILSFAGQHNSVEEAVESQQARKYLFLKSLEYTIKFPLFGVGAAQFSTYEAFHNEVGGMRHGMAHSTHCSFTQVSAECGIPALLFFVFGIILTYTQTARMYRQTRGQPANQDIRAAAFCILLSMVGFTVAITFLNFGYFFYQPLHAALAIALTRTGKEELRERALTPVAAKPALFRAAGWRLPQRGYAG